MKRLIKIVFPFLFPTIPVIVYALFEGKSIVVPLLFVWSLTICSQFIYNNKILDVISLSTTIIIGFVFLFICPLCYAYCLWEWGSLALPALIIASLIAYLTLIAIIKYGNSFKSVIIGRKFLFVMIMVTTISFIIPGLYSVLDTSGHNKSRFSFDTNMVGLLSSFFWIIIICVELYHSWRKLFIFSNYYKPFYILYLRRFSIDNTSVDEKCLDALSKNNLGLDVMKIGNPKKLFQSSYDYSCVYLPTKDWQKHLSKYIQCAKVVFAQVDISDGVLWELFENTKYADKYIYNVPIVKDIPNILNNFENKVKNKKDPYYLWINCFLSYLIPRICEYNSLLFAFDGNTIVFSHNVESILEFKVIGKNNNLHRFKCKLY